jgi:general secretion pathway protein C
MQALPFERANVAESALVALATFVALALLAVVLAYWMWAWFAPRPEPRAPAAVQAGGATVEVANGLFGNAQAAKGIAASSGSAKLVGVVAASGSRPGYAVLRLDAKKSVAVQQGEEIEPGLRLAEVHADHVVLDRSGAREKLPLPEKSGK